MAHPARTPPARDAIPIRKCLGRVWNSVVSARPAARATVPCPDDLAGGSLASTRRHHRAVGQLATRGWSSCLPVVAVGGGGKEPK